MRERGLAMVWNLRCEALRPFLSVLPLLLTASQAGGQSIDRADLVAALDSAVSAHVQEDLVAGVSVAVVRATDTLMLRGYGLADLEWDTPTPADAVGTYEIGSMTKQFTAAAILALVEEGKLDLEAPFTDYLPEFNTGGYQVSLRRLLDHTSGIKGYTELPFFEELAMKKLPRDTLVSLVEAEPFDFEPGTALIYNNSAYFLLGLIIEEVSGQSYEEYLEARFFSPLGMEDTYYCSERAVREHRVHGYDASPEGLVRKGYLDHTWPYAAGSLCSSVRDLVRWNQALHGGEVLSAESYRALITPRPLLDGTPTRYAMGLGVRGSGRHRVIAHGGGINGFLSDGRYYPEERLIIVVLQNSTGSRGPGALSESLADIVMGPAPPLSGTPFGGDLEALLGTYSGPARGRRLTVQVTRDGDDLVFTTEGSANEMRPVHLEALTWGLGNTRLWFVRDGDRVTGLRLDQGSGLYVLGRSQH
jgi:CubicO group peptidase (beta-lactamase class C family)